MNNSIFTNLCKTDDIIEEKKSFWLHDLVELQISKRPASWAENWEQTAPALFQSLVGATLQKWHEAARLEGLEREILLLKRRVADLDKFAPLWIPVQTFAPEPYEVMKPFNVIVQRSGDEFVASFLDANLNASGSTEEEAFSNLKDIITGVFDCLTEHDEAKLGPGPLKQLRVLKTFLKKRT